MAAVRVAITARDGVELVGDRYGAPGADTVLFFHGGGQTRHSWGGTAEAMARKGWTAMTLDHRGHGESGWAPGNRYRFEDYANDAREWIATLDQAPVIVGASLGGIAAMLALGHAPEAPARALVLVDIAPRIEKTGSDRILGFMRERVDTGFATLEEAAAAVQAYTPERRRPVDTDSIRKNLRERDGRWFWHWDPGTLRIREHDSPEALEARLVEGVSRIECPLLLVRGRYSDVVSQDSVDQLLSLRPDAAYVDVSGAGHMVAGDRNDVFTDAVLEFLDKAAPLTRVA